MQLNIRLVATAALCGAAFSPAPASARDTPAPNAAIAPEIRAEMGKMADALKALSSYEMKVEMTSEDVLDDGQKLQSSSVLTVDARRPNRLFVDIDSDRRARKLYYDGKTLTILAPAKGYYATVDAPPTTHDMIEQAADKYGVETPLADLFYWGADAVKLDGVTSAMYAGSDRIAGQACDQFAFRQDGTDWQIWIRKDGPALPCKLVIVNTDDDSHPQSTALFTWRTDATFNDEVFAFRPPAGAHRIALTSLDSANTKVSQK
jgi:hypothetical protein